MNWKVKKKLKGNKETERITGVLEGWDLFEICCDLPSFTTGIMQNWKLLEHVDLL